MAVNSPNWFQILKSTILIALTQLDSSMMVCTFLIRFGPSARVSEISHAKTLGKKDLNFDTIAGCQKESGCRFIHIISRSSVHNQLTQTKGPTLLTVSLSTSASHKCNRQHNRKHKENYNNVFCNLENKCKQFMFSKTWRAQQREGTSGHRELFQLQCLQLLPSHYSLLELCLQLSLPEAAPASHPPLPRLSQSVPHSLSLLEMQQSHLQCLWNQRKLV